jgi:hypothetical protein
MKKLKNARREPKYTCFDQCLVCKEIKEEGQYTSDGELVCNFCCKWLEEEGRKINEL